MVDSQESYLLSINPSFAKEFVLSLKSIDGKPGELQETILEKTWDSRYFIKQKHLSGKKLELWWTDVDLFYG